MPSSHWAEVEIGGKVHTDLFFLSRVPVILFMN